MQTCLRFNLLRVFKHKQQQTKIIGSISKKSQIGIIASLHGKMAVILFIFSLIHILWLEYHLKKKKEAASFCKNCNALFTDIVL